LGWSAFEGTHRFRKDVPAPPGAIGPVFEYDHSEGQAVVGGYVYRGTKVPAMVGAYLFADTYQGELRVLSIAGGKVAHRKLQAAHLEQVAVRALADHVEWDSAVAATLPEPYRATAADDAAAGRDLRSLVRTPKPNLPAWNIVEPAPADELRRYYQEGEARFGV